jgi:hypothetical protein
MAGIATVVLSWSMGFTHLSLPPRGLYAPFDRGATVGPTPALQRQALEAALSLLAQPAPTEPVRWKPNE